MCLLFQQFWQGALVAGDDCLPLSLDHVHSNTALTPCLLFSVLTFPRCRHFVGRFDSFVSGLIVLFEPTVKLFFGSVLFVFLYDPWRRMCAKLYSKYYMCLIEFTVLFVFSISCSGAEAPVPKMGSLRLF